MDREGRCGGVKELLGVVVGENNPEIGAQRSEPGADLGRRPLDPLDGASIFGLGHCEELRGVGQHRPADHA
jgi:hypothetical protein